MPAKTKTKYTAREIQVLEGLEPVRKRPGMYIGSTDTRGLHELIREIVDNSVDESFAGVANNIWVHIEKDGSAAVRDDGRGIPVDKHKSGVSALEVTMTKLHAGGKFGGGAYKISGGLHGVGASVVNALSSEFRVIVLRGGKAYYQEYKRGQPKAKVNTVNQSQIDKWVPESWKIKLKNGETGTITQFNPDSTVFKNFSFDNKKNYTTRNYSSSYILMAYYKISPDGLKNVQNRKYFNSTHCLLPLRFFIKLWYCRRMGGFLAIW